MSKTTIANRYEVIDKLGQGGMGAVYRVYDRLEKTEVALKQVLISEKQLTFASQADTDDTDKLRLSLAHEFSILATLRHPHILSVLDFGFDDKGHPFYTMTLLEGGQDVKTYATELSQGKRIVLLGQMLQALHYLHRRGVLHRDLKPDNIFVNKDEEIKVMDFGLAKQEKDQITQSNTIEGTINYMAPELFKGEPASEASDLFAVGVIVYEIMVGQHPYEANTITERIVKIMTHTPDFSAIPDDFVPWLETILQKDPTKRFSTAYDAMHEFYNAVGIDAPAEDVAIRESFLQASAFIGRDVELKQLTDALQNIYSENAFFLIGGESGVGKSRLLDELRVRALVSNADVMRGQAVDGGGLLFQVWRNIVRRLLLSIEVTDLQAGVLKDIVPDIDTLLQRDIPDAPKLIGKAYKDRIVITIVDLLRQIQHPLVLLLEDLHWADESINVIKQLILVQEQLNTLMIVASYRNDEVANLPEILSGMVTIPLERLQEDGIEALSHAMLGQIGKREALMELLQTQSEGNPFFIIETIRYLAEESGQLGQIGNATLPPNVFTGGMQQIMKRRLSKVDKAYSKLQTLASILGRNIDSRLLAHHFASQTIGSWLVNASEFGIVTVQDNTWRFAHDKLRDTILSDLDDDEKPSVHRAAAEAIESVYLHNDAYNEALLTHWHEAGNFDKELFYLDLVAKRMIELIGTYDVVEKFLKDARERLTAHDPRSASITNWLASISRIRGHYPEAIQYANQANEIAQNNDDKSNWAISLGHLGYVAWRQGQLDNAYERYEESLLIHREINYQRGIAEVLNMLGNITADWSQYDRAQQFYEESLMIHQEINHQRGISENLNNLGAIAWEQGDYQVATTRFEEGLIIRKELGDKRNIAGTLNNLGVIASDLGDYDKATDLYKQSLAIRKELGDQQSIARSLSNLGAVAWKEGAYKRASEFAQYSLDIRRKIDDQSGIAYSLHYLGIIAFEQSQYEQAHDFLVQSLTIRKQLKNQAGQAMSLAYMGFVAFKQNQSSSLNYMKQSLAIAHDIGTPIWKLFNLVGLAGVLQQRGDSIRAIELLGLVQHHPSTNSEVRRRIDDLMPILQKSISSEKLQSSLEEGQKLDLDTVVQELLNEFGDTM